MGAGSAQNMSWVRPVFLLFACLLRLDGVGAQKCNGTCVINSDRITPAGRIPLSDTVVTAVGCREVVEVQFGRHELFGVAAPLPQTVYMVAADGIQRITASAVLDDSLEGIKTKVCCTEHPMVRDKMLEEAGLSGEKCVTEPEQALIPFDMVSCMRQTYNRTTGTARVEFIVPERADMNAYGSYNPMGTSDGMEAFILVAEYESADTKIPKIPTAGYKINIQIQRCSACLRKGEGLNGLAKRFATHWSQIYSSNHDIIGSPDTLVESRLMRLGSMYAVRDGDTLMSIALKFGVTVNTLFMWNGHLRNQLNSMPESPNKMSRALTIGQQLCVLPKTCQSSYGGVQPVFTEWEVSPAAGGSVGLPYLVEPPVPPPTLPPTSS